MTRISAALDTGDQRLIASPLALRGKRAADICRSLVPAQGVVQALEAEAEGSPEREVVEPDEPADPKPRLAVVPRGRSEDAAEDAATRVLDTEDADSVDRRPVRKRSVPYPVVHGLEQRLREPVDGDVQKVARAQPARVRPDEQRVDSPSRQSVHEEALNGGRAARAHAGTMLES